MAGNGDRAPEWYAPDARARRGAPGQQLYATIRPPGVSAVGLAQLSVLTSGNSIDPAGQRKVITSTR